ncbi:Kirola [Sesamum angolense]|uniref:Kirola n=1 Tax=Sesamum angolense TaxID=2727404 RepID=A0AAE1WEG4_9LAMI|nr:Kirola [Sesamum angolense]
MSPLEKSRLVICIKAIMGLMARSFMKYILDGKEQTAKQLLHDIDETKKQIKFKMLEGDLLELYKNMVLAVHVETKGGVDFITWTVEYELINPNNPHPISVLNWTIEFTKDVEAHIFG